MNQYDPLRILWIDDCEGLDDRYRSPMPELPEEYRAAFKIVRPPTATAPSTVCNPQQFSALFNKFWFGGDQSIFPVEIVAMDYNLTKWADGSVQPQRDPTVQAQVVAKILEEPVELPTDFESAAPRQSVKEGFEGLVIGIFCAALVSHHPTGVVPMTNYSDQLGDIDEVRALHTLSRRLLNVDYSQFHLSRNDRTWANILRNGVVSLRERITLLAKSNHVVPSFQSILNLASKSGSVLEIDSRYGRRRWSIDGLFVDSPSEETRRAAAQDWATELLGKVTEQVSGCGDMDAFKETLRDWHRGRELADTLWTAYINRPLRTKRDLLSRAVAAVKSNSRDTGSLTDEERHAIEFFGVDLEKEITDGKTKCTSDKCIDLRLEGFTDRQRRWAVLMLIVQVVHLRWAAQDAWRERCQDQAPQRLKDPADNFDVYDALFPIPSTPVVLPWHQPNSPERTWHTLRSLGKKPKEASGKASYNDLGLLVEDVLKGRDRNPPVYGTSPGERIVMQMYARDLYGGNTWEDDPQMHDILRPEAKRNAE